MSPYYKKMFLMFEKTGAGKRFGLLTDIVLILVLGLSATFLLTFQIDQLPGKISIGSVALSDIKADQNYEIVDDKSSQSLREEAVKNVLPIYDFDTTVESNMADKIHEAFEGARVFLAENSLFDNQKQILSDDLENQMKREFQGRLDTDMDDASYQMVRSLQFDPRLEKSSQNLIRDVMQTPIVFSLDDIKNHGERGFILRRLSKLEPFPEEVMRDISHFKTLPDVVKELAYNGIDKANFYLSRFQNIRNANQAILNIALGMVRVNVNYNSLETDLRKEKAQGNVKNIIIKMKRGESIIRSGDRFDSWHLTVIEGMRKARDKTNAWFKFLGIFLFVNLVITIVYYYSAKYIKKFRPSRKDLVFLGLTLVSFLVFLRLGVFLVSSLRDAIPFQVGFLTAYYLLPIAAGAMLVRFVLNSETALIFSVIISFFAGIFLENNLELTIYYLISSVFAAHVIAHVDKRSSVLRAGVLTGLINMVTILSLHFISMEGHEMSAVWNIFVTDALSGFLGGMLTSIVVLSLTPVAETLFNYTTDIKLLELANMSHPLLKQMILKAPGTYHHSQLVGILSEAGAQSIGANPLLARVASYYHDIGKMKKPQYYIENQRGENPHDKLVPTMSAIIIAAHVIDGIEMAKEYKLPQKIADMIPQHQGTKLVGYFYNKAKKIAETTQSTINENDFRYTGPKPQTKEAGIIMLADTIEAAVRSQADKNPEKIRASVEKLLNQHFVEQQLDECDLTLRDLHHIAEAFVKVLIGIYHQRIEYNVTLPQQPAFADSNVTHLFRNKDQGPA